MAERNYAREYAGRDKAKLKRRTRETAEQNRRRAREAKQRERVERALERWQAAIYG